MNDLFGSVTGAFGSAAQSAANVAPSNGVSSWFSNQLSSTTSVDANGMPTEKDEETPAEQFGGRRRRKMKKQCGGSFHPYTPSSDLSSTASAFKGGRRKRTYRKKSHRKSHKKSHRKSHRKRR